MYILYQNKLVNLSFLIPEYRHILWAQETSRIHQRYHPTSIQRGARLPTSLVHSGGSYRLLHLRPLPLAPRIVPAAIKKGHDILLSRKNVLEFR